MKALVLKQFGSTENFSMEEISEPQVGKGEVLIQVKAIDRNRLGRGRHRHQGGG